MLSSGLWPDHVAAAATVVGVSGMADGQLCHRVRQERLQHQRIGRVDYKDQKCNVQFQNFSEKLWSAYAQN